MEPNEDMGCHFDGRDPLSFLEWVAELQEEYCYTDEQSWPVRVTKRRRIGLIQERAR